MKKIIAMILMAALVIGLAACTPKDPAGESATGTFRIGYGQASMNPVEPVPLGGYGNTSTRMSQNITDDLYIRCTAITDAYDNTALIFTIDSTRVYNPVVDYIPSLCAKLGIPGENIWVNASHSHSTPDMSNSAQASIPRYIAYFQGQMLSAAEAALADRLPAKIFYGTVETEGLSWIRHYIMDDGSYAGDSFGDWDNHYAVSHTAEPDTTMHILKFTREGGKDVVLTNWRVHPGLTGNAGKALDASADVVGPYREILEDMTDSHVMYLQGHAGNTNPGSRMTEEVMYDDYKEYGALLAEFAYEGMQNMKEMEPGELKTRRVMLTAKIDHSMDHMASEASLLSSLWASTNDRELIYEKGRPIGIRSPYHASAIASKARMGETDTLEINALCIGDSIAMTGGPAELFDRNSMAIEEASPFEVNMCLAYTNGHKLYIPADYVWEYTSYETDISRYVRGTAEDIQNTMLGMLEDMKNS